MKRIPLLLLAIFAVFQANAQIVNIRTDRSSWIIRIDADGRLNTLHYGAAIDNPEALANYANGVTDTHGTPYETYPTQGERNSTNPPSP